MTLKISDSSQFSTNQTNLSNTPKKILVTLSSVRASSQEEAEALLKALGFTQSDIEAFKDKYGVDLKTRFASEFSGKSSKVTKDASSKPGFQAYIGINSRNYKLLTGFLAERRAATKTPLPMKPTETAEGKKIYDNSAFQALKLKKLADQAQVETTSTGTPNRLDELRHFNVRIAPGAKAAETDKILSALIDKTFGDRIEFARNRETIGQIAKLSGVELKNVKINGNRAEFDLTLEDTLKLRVAYNKVQDDLNSAEAVYRDTVDNNTFSQFAAGVFEGASDSIAGTANVLIDPVGTAKALWQVIGNPSETFNALYKELENTSEKFKAADHVERSRMIGKLLGSVITGILIGKGAGELGALLKATKTGAALIEKAKLLKSATVAKIAETFSDEAAQLAKQRLLKTFPAGGQPLVVLPGAPLSAKAIADFGVMVGNKIGKGATSFREIVKQMSAEVGEAVKPHLDELAEAYRQQMKRLGLKADESEITTIFKEWKADRAKNINEIIEVPKLSEIGGKGWAERQALRQKIGQADFADYSKHIKARDEIDAMRRSISGKKPEAQFLPKLKNDVRKMYKEAIDNAVNNGLFKKEGGKWVFFHKFEEPIGYNLGKETKWLRVELTDNSSPSIHGHPTNLKEVRNRFPDVKGEK